MQAKIAVITGAAGAIGRAIAQGFAAEGINLAMFDNRGEALNQFCEQLANRHSRDRVIGCCVDIRNTRDIEQGFDRVMQTFGAVDILVNNAAVTGINTVDAITDEEIDSIIDVDLKGYIRCTRRAVAEMKKAQRGGNILMVSSKNGLEGASEKCLYSAAKGGILTMARALAKELGPFNIRVNSICPDAVLEGSYIWREGGDYRKGTCRRYGITSAQIPEYYRQRCVLKRTITPEDVAAAAVFLASDKAQAITGVILPVDGGVAFVR
jgi:NAD(P)-dependent dehydrogenase (short-subunit alcohol dehydrogenase family)